VDPLLVFFGTVTEAAGVLGISVRTLYRWMRDGISAEKADRAAVRIGLHPANLWPEWFAGC
jgi:excisionase family DNA binding protein